MIDTYVEGTQVVTRAICLTPYTVGSIDEGSTALTVRDADGFANADPVVVEAAGPEGGHLFTTVAAVVGNTITLADPAATTVRRVSVGKRVDPGTRTFTARRGDETPTVYDSFDPEVTSPMVGVWELRLVNDERDWAIHFQGTTPCHCAGEAFYRIKRARALA